MKTKRPDPKDPLFPAYIAEKERIILAHAKKTIPKTSPEDDPFGDRELFDREVTRYFVCSGKTLKIDANAKGKHRHIVKTKMFGGCAKHLDSVEVEQFRQLLHHPTL